MSENTTEEKDLDRELDEASPEEVSVQSEPTPEVAEGSASTAAPSELDTVKAELTATRIELDSTKDQLLRKAADFDNYRKRMMKEKEEAQKFANSSLLADLVQVLDDFERAIRSSEQAKDYESFHSGIVMIEAQFASMLERKYNLKRFESLGEPFHPDFHEAISTEAQEEGKDVVVVEEYQKGYQLHERVLRTAKVRVGHAKDASENTDEIKG